MAIIAVAAACADAPTAPTASEISPLGARPSFNLSSSPIDMWSPTEGAIFSGEQKLAGVLKGYSPNQYDMYWRVDGAGWGKMANATSPSAHKYAYINADGWTWSGTGPYLISFQARDKTGRVVAERSASIFVARAGLNLFKGATFFADPYSNAKQQASAWATTRPEDAKLMGYIAQRAQADWFGDWNGDIAKAVGQRMNTVTEAGALPVFVAYNIPIRDCRGYSGGGATSASAYRSWISAFAKAIGARKAVVILEPDALAALDCLTAADQKLRMSLIRDAVRTLKTQPNVSVYVDGGNPGWKSAAVMADRLNTAGIGFADGFALNVSNYFSTRLNLEYGEALAARVGGKHFVIDTSRNGLGESSTAEWCNPLGRALGESSSATTGHPLVDAFFWIKRPGESDGSCNGGPSAGGWWAEYALGLATNMPVQLAALW